MTLRIMAPVKDLQHCLRITIQSNLFHWFNARLKLKVYMIISSAFLLEMKKNALITLLGRCWQEALWSALFSPSRRDRTESRPWCPL